MPLLTAQKELDRLTIRRRLTKDGAKTFMEAVKDNLNIQKQYETRLKKLRKTESVNYEEVDTEETRKVPAHVSARRRAGQMCFRFSLGTLIAVVGAAIVFFTIQAGEKIHYTVFHGILFNEQMSIFARWASVVCASLGLSLTSCLLVLYYPAVGGSGLPEVMAFLNGTVVRPYLKFRVLILKAIASILAYSSGLYLDMEAPGIHIGTIVAVTIGRLFYNNKRFRAYLSPGGSGGKIDNFEQIRHAVYQDETFRTFAAAGAAVGMTVAVRAPVGGVAFVLEEATSYFKPQVILYTLFMTTVAYWVILGVITLRGLNAVTDDVLSFFSNVECYLDFRFTQLYIATNIGVVCAVLARIYISMAGYMQKLRNRIRPRSIYVRLADVALVSILTMTAICFLPMAPAFNECKPVEKVYEAQFQMITDVCGGYCLDGRPVFRKDCVHPKGWQQCSEAQMVMHIEADLIAEIVEAGKIYCSTPATSDANFTYFPPMLYRGAAQMGFSLPKLSHMAIKFAESAGHVSPDTPDVLLGVATVAGANTTKETPDVSVLNHRRRSASADQVAHCVYEMRSLMWVSGHGTIKHLFSMGDYNLFSAKVLTAFLFVFTPLAILTTGCSVPAGAIVPVMIVGAAGGRLFAVAINSLGAWARWNQQLVDPGAYAILGAAGLWAGVGQIPFTVLVVMFETTGLNVMLWGPQILVVVTVATFLSRWMGHSLYHMQIHDAHIPFLDFDPEPHLKSMTVAQMMTPKVLVVQRGSMAVHEAEILINSGHHSFPLVDEAGLLIGLVYREEVQIAFAAADASNSVAVTVTRYHMSPSIARDTDSAAHAYYAVRSQGLRELIVVDYRNRPVGIVTRKDLARANHHTSHRHYDPDSRASIASTSDMQVLIPPEGIGAQSSEGVTVVEGMVEATTAHEYQGAKKAAQL